MFFWNFMGAYIGLREFITNVDAHVVGYLNYARGMFHVVVGLGIFLGFARRLQRNKYHRLCRFNKIIIDLSGLFVDYSYCTTFMVSIVQETIPLAQIQQSTTNFQQLLMNKIST